MSEEVDDTRSGTITLTVPEADVTCDGETIHYDTGCLLLKHYDADYDGKISMREIMVANAAYADGNLTQKELDFVTAAWNTTSINALCSECYTVPGELVEVDIPASVEQGASYDVTAKVHNKGEYSAVFVVRWYINTVLKSASGEFTLAAGATSVDKVQPTTPLTAPTTGTSMTYDLRLVRII